MLVAAPKATRTARETFAATLGRGLADRHGALTLRPGALRCLDRVDTVVMDPSILQTAELRVSRIRGVRDADRTRVWEAARSAVDREEFGPGWHLLADLPGDLGAAGEHEDAAVFVTPAHHPLAAAVLAQARTSGVAVVSVDTESLGSLRSAFDDLHPSSGAGEFRGSPDRDLRDAVVHLQAEGATVAVVAAGAPSALASADVGIRSWWTVRPRRGRRTCSSTISPGCGEFSEHCPTRGPRAGAASRSPPRHRYSAHS